MLILFALAGLIVGWLLNSASHYLPGRRMSAKSGLTRLPSLFSFLAEKRPYPIWFGLHLGVEILTICVFVWLGSRFGLRLETLIFAISYSLFALIAIIDWKYRLILNRVTYPAMIVALAVQIILLRHDLYGVLIGGLLAFGIFFLVAQLKPGQLGGGDVKLAALIGLTFGFPQVLGALIVGAGAGGVMAIFLLLRQARLQYRLPYAPFLCFGAITVLLYYSLLNPL